jgi:hypothetical protein
MKGLQDMPAMAAKTFEPVQTINVRIDPNYYDYVVSQLKWGQEVQGFVLVGEDLALALNGKPAAIIAKPERAN